MTTSNALEYERLSVYSRTWSENENIMAVDGIFIHFILYIRDLFRTLSNILDGCFSGNS